MAELTSAVTHWLYTAPNPIDCYTDTANCVTPLVDQYTDLEVVLLGICPTEQYNPVTVTRLLWDLNDDHNDPTYTDAFTMAYWEMLANLDFPDGYNDDESNEPWAAPISPATVPSLIDNENGRSVTDYLGHVPYNVLTQQNFNCQP